MNHQEKKAWFFSHTECEYFPCHPTDKPEDFNCLFCYCPLYSLGEQCNGNYSYNDKGIKDCSKCFFPHDRRNYSAIVNKIPKVAEIAMIKDSASAKNNK